jgi:hypothetical protein
MYPAAGTVQGWDDFHGRPHPTGTASLDALVDAGIITGWSFVNGNRDRLSLSFQADTVPIAIGICAAQPELCAVVAVGVTISIYVVWPELKELLEAIQRSKTDITQNRQAAQQVSKEPGCRKPTPQDFETVHEILKAQKSKGETVTYDDLLDAWREVLCPGH